MKPPLRYLPDSVYEWLLKVLPFKWMYYQREGMWLPKSGWTARQIAEAEKKSKWFN
ncbi:MAG TPA: hypothetical protein VK589_06085 [Chryseolinea sp.]|nr:hypothetical protein [Chryseolinea sp.]